MDLDEQLKQLAITAQQSPPQTPQRQRALAQLVSLIYQSGKLVRPHRGQFYGVYDEIYADAQQRLFLYMCEQIERYNPELEVLQWANFLMKKRFFIEASREIRAAVPKGIKSENARRITLDALDKQNPIDQQLQESPSLSDEVKQCIQEDTDGLFQSTHVENKPAANFQYIALYFLNGYSWKEISADVDVKVVTLSSFYQRCLTKFAPVFKEYLSK